MFRNSEEFKIHNDIVLYYRPSIQQLRNSFKDTQTVQLNKSKPDEITQEDKQGLIIIFQELTGMNSIWCKKYLFSTHCCDKKKQINLNFCHSQTSRENQLEFPRSIGIFYGISS